MLLEQLWGEQPSTFIQVKVIAMILTEETWKRYRANQGCVYLVHATGTNRYKIGRSTNLAFRLDQLRGQSPYPLTCLEWFWSPDAIADEKALHAEVKFSRVYGEWFELAQITESDRAGLKTLELDLWKKFLNSVDSLRSKYFHGSRPEARAISNHLAEFFIAEIFTEIEGIKTVVDNEGENSSASIRTEVEKLIYLGLVHCQSLTHLQQLCYFVEQGWIDAIDKSIIKFTFDYPVLLCAIHGTFYGFLASIPKSSSTSRL